MQNERFLLRVAQSVAREYVSRLDADRVGEAVLRMALSDWEGVAAAYPECIDELDRLERYTRDLLDDPQVLQRIVSAA
ncbi:MAG: hypothetical protein GYB64_05215 [Chloroflexi bacterium]|nr:hypothetical protein [Chloroflexota bacterium]